MKQELRDNLVQRLREGKPCSRASTATRTPCCRQPGPRHPRWHSINLLGLRGQARPAWPGARALLDEWMPVVAGGRTA